MTKKYTFLIERTVSDQIEVAADDNDEAHEIAEGIAEARADDEFGNPSDTLVTLLNEEDF